MSLLLAFCGAMSAVGAGLLGMAALGEGLKELDGHTVSWRDLGFFALLVLWAGCTVIAGLSLVVSQFVPLPG